MAYSGIFSDGKEVGWGIRKHNDGRRYEGIKEGQANEYGVGMFKDGRRNALIPGGKMEKLKDGKQKSVEL
jgi:hypothetical protein